MILFRDQLGETKVTSFHKNMVIIYCNIISMISYTVSPIFLLMNKMSRAAEVCYNDITPCHYIHFLRLSTSVSSVNIK